MHENQMAPTPFLWTEAARQVSGWEDDEEKRERAWDVRSDLAESTY